MRAPLAKNRRIARNVFRSRLLWAVASSYTSLSLDVSSPSADNLDCCQCRNSGPNSKKGRPNPDLRSNSSKWHFRLLSERPVRTEKPVQAAWKTPRDPGAKVSTPQAINQREERWVLLGPPIPAVSRQPGKTNRGEESYSAKERVAGSDSEKWPVPGEAIRLQNKSAARRSQSRLLP